MEQEQLIRIETFCVHHQVDHSFIHSLGDSGVIKVINIEGTEFIDSNHLNELEKLARLHYEMDINVEGVEAISYLLNRLQEMHHDLLLLRNRLSQYEPLE